MGLKYRVFVHSHLGVNSTSTLFYGERDAVLVDASQLLSDTHRMVAEIILARKNLTHIYVSHFHPDHHFGLGVLQDAFPRAKIVALPSVVRDIVFTSSDKLDMWAIDRSVRTRFQRRPPIPCRSVGLASHSKAGTSMLRQRAGAAAPTPWSGPSLGSSRGRVVRQDAR